MDGKKIVKLGIVISVLLFVGIVGFFELATPKAVGTDTFVVLRGENVLQIANDLKSQGYITSKTLFIISVFLSEDLKKLKAGTYDLKGLGSRQIIQKLVLSQTIPIELTIIPGSTIKDVSDSLQGSKIISGQDFLNLALPSGSGDFYSRRQKLANQFDYLADLPQNAGFEGFLYPDTYHIAAKTTSEDVASQILQNFGDKLTLDLRAQIKDQGKTVFEIVTMASLLEKEVKNYQDKQIVAGILWKRENEGMLLEVDSTLLYFLASDHPSANDKDIDSRYNTYKYAGLPAGPICNPGIESIKAAIYPADTDYWFYLNKPDGTTVFSKTYAEHLINKAKYLDK